jgi:hypothetical protein
MTFGLTTDLDTERYVLMCRDLQAMAPDKTFGDVLRVTLAQVLKFCIKNTRAASRSGIVQRATRQSTRYTFPGGEQISVSKRHPGHLSFLDTSTFKPNSKQSAPKYTVDGKSWHDMSEMEWSDARWAKYQAFLAEMQAANASRANKKGSHVKAALASRGLAKHSWYQIAEAIDMAAAVDAPGWVKDAKPQNGREYQNGRARKVLEGAAAFIEVFNDYPAEVRMGGQRLLNYGIIARAKAFEREVELGVFRNAKVRAERYPGIFVFNS